MIVAITIKNTEVQSRLGELDAGLTTSDLHTSLTLPSGHCLVQTPQLLVEYPPMQGGYHLLPQASQANVVFTALHSLTVKKPVPLVYEEGEALSHTCSL